MFDNEQLIPAFQTFLRYGFKKTSMEDLARAMGVSRQALYKKYGSKEAILERVTKSLVEASTHAALAALTADGMTLGERLYQALDQWVGQHVEPMRSSPHSGEVLAMTDHSADSPIKTLEASLRKAFELRLEAEKPELAAADVTYALFAASYGLLYKAQDHAEYESGMRRVLTAFGLDQAHLAH
ncbi:TetR/AcrR family transcriptional regulator [Maricaulis sp.]|uniref:TetR/AcrR family transcriptional regulator n=1 Tax=unclassified Maricaulis TaxID=2632371 RepID=UPI001B111633|nr:TetR/AcrR family transcriptional regulator [Maricaulis sp.]MBO6796471.1 helix-turn-helix transcriptional regulator [Maricaulis sp.]